MFGYKKINHHAPHKLRKIILPIMLFAGAWFLLARIVNKSELSLEDFLSSPILGTIMLIFVVLTIIYLTLLSLITRDILLEKLLKFEKGDTIVKKGLVGQEMSDSASEILSAGKRAYGVIDINGRVGKILFIHQNEYEITNKIKLPKEFKKSQ